MSTPSSSSSSSSSASNASNFDLLFSQELVDLFIDQLCDNTRDLKSCSLVSYRWLPRTRKHLFSELSIPCHKSRTCSNKFSGRKGRGEELTGEEMKERMKEINELLVPSKNRCIESSSTECHDSGVDNDGCTQTHTLPLIAAYVKKLTLWADYSWGLPNRIGLYPLHAFPPSSLEEIAIVDFFFTSVPPNSKSILPEFLKTHQGTLKSLRLEHLTFDSPGELVELITSVCVPVDGSGFGSGSGSECKNFPLRDLSLIDVNFHPLEDWRVDNTLTNDPQIASRRIAGSAITGTGVGSEAGTGDALPVDLPRPKLKTLEISCIPELLGPLFLDPYAFFDLSGLKRLKLRTSNGNVYRYRRIFQEFGESIREVEVGFPSAPELLLSPLQPLNNLTHITLHSCFYTNQFHAIPTIIPLLPRHKQLTITSKFAFPSFPCLSDMEADENNLLNGKTVSETRELRKKEMQRTVGNILGNILTRSLDEELVNLFRSNVKPNNDSEMDYESESGSRFGTDDTTGGETRKQQKVLPERIVFAFEFPCSHTMHGSASDIGSIDQAGMKDKTCLPRTRSLKVVDVEVICTTYFRAGYSRLPLLAYP